MTGGERYLVVQAKRQRQEYQLSRSLSPRLPCLSTRNLSLQDAPGVFRHRLHDILHPPSSDPQLPQSQFHLRKTVFDNVDLARFDSGITDFDSFGGHAATIVGSSQQGKTSLLNSLLKLFGFVYPDVGVLFPSSDLLPTHSKNRAGLPFPVRLQYHCKYELVLQRWDAGRLQNVMCKVAEEALATNADYFEDLECGMETVTEGSFLEFVAQHGAADTQHGYLPKATAVATLNADSGLELYDFADDGGPNPSLATHEAVPQFLLKLVEDGRWLRYEYVTLKCPSQLLKHLNAGSQALRDTYVLDLPGVGIVDDNNALVEELVVRDVSNAGTIIVLTGERSFTGDVLHILKSSVFERLLDPLVSPRPTVAITNSRNLRGLKEEEMGIWRAATLNGSLGWNRELKSFVEEVFSERRHRDLQTLEPDLFPNDLEGFLQSRTGATERGVSMLVGYFLRLPQEALVTSITDVLERARSVTKMVDQLWQAEIVSWKGPTSSRLIKEAKSLRDEEFLKDLDAELAPSVQKRIFGFEREGTLVDGERTTLDMQVDYISKLFREQKRKLEQRFERLKDGNSDWNQDLPRMVKESLLQIASQWDETVGDQAFQNFLTYGVRMSQALYKKWARKLFPHGGKDGVGGEKEEQAFQFMVNYLNGAASAAICKDTFKYTFTHGLRLQAWNLDFKDIAKMVGLRRGRSATAAYKQVWVSAQGLMNAKEAYFKEQVLEHMSLQSSSVKQLIHRLKKVVLDTFEECERNYVLVMDALARIATGRLAISEDPVVVLREGLESLVNEIDRYLSKHREMRDGFGAQELRKVLQLQSEC